MGGVIMYKVNPKYIGREEAMEHLIESKFNYYPCSLVLFYITGNRGDGKTVKECVAELNKGNTGAKKDTYISEELFTDCVDLLLSLGFIEEK